MVTSCRLPEKWKDSRLQLRLCLGSTDRLITACSKQMAAMGQTVYLREFVQQIRHFKHEETISQLAMWNYSNCSIQKTFLCPKRRGKKKKRPPPPPPSVATIVSLLCRHRTLLLYICEWVWRYIHIPQCKGKKYNLYPVSKLWQVWLHAT